MATTVDGSTGVSQIQDDKVTVAKLDLISTASVPSLEAKGTSGVTSGYLKLNCSENSHGIKLLGPPHSATADYTLTFPNNDGDANQFLQTNGSGVMSWAAAGGGMTLLDTLTTTSGTSHVADSLDLSTYKFLYVSFYNVGWATDGRFLQWKETGSTSVYITAQIDAGNKAYGVVIHDLSLGIAISSEVETSAAVDFKNRQDTTQGTINTAIDTATTSITFDWEAGTAFNTGTIKLYGLN